MIVEALTVDRCWTTQDGLVMASCARKVGNPVSVTLPRPIEPGGSILAERSLDRWSFVEAAAPRAGP